MHKTLLSFYAGMVLTGLITVFILIPVYSPESIGHGVAPSLFPTLAASCMTFFSFVLLLGQLRSKEGEGKPAPFSPRMAGRIVLFLLTYYSIFPLAEKFGLIPASMIALVALQLLAGQRRPLVIAAVSACAAVGAYYAITGLGVPLP